MQRDGRGIGRGAATPTVEHATRTEAQPGRSHDVNTLKVSQDWVSPATAEVAGKKSIPIPELANIMERDGWRGDPLEVVQEAGGSVISIDNRRIVAARQANSQAQSKQMGTPLPEVPIKTYKHTDGFPPSHWVPEKIKSFKLQVHIRRSAKDGRLYRGDGPAEDTILYRKNASPANMGEAALFRTANQKKQSLEPTRYPDTDGYFPIGGTTNTPIIKR